MADNSILPKASAPLVDQTGRPTRAFYTFFNALVSNLQGQISSISKLVKNLALVIAALGGDPDSGEGIPDIAGQIDAKADKAITITGLGSIQGGGDLSQDRFISLDGDVDTVPGVSFYGSPDGSTKGWAAFSGNFTPSMDADDNVTLDLATVADAGGGTLQRTEFDAYGRKTGTSAATTTDLTEGSNLYFTDERADARITAAKADPDGIASLISGKLDPGQLPALAITETFVVADEAAMLALTAEEGDVAVRTDLSKSFILTASPASTLANWQELLTPTGGVSSFNGRTGSVTPASGDYTKAQVGLGNVDNTSDADKPVSTAQAASIATRAPDAQVQVSAVITANQSLANSSTVKVLLNSAVVDSGGYFNTSTSKFQPLKAGTYLVLCTVSLVYVSGTRVAGERLIAYVYKNGASFNAITSATHSAVTNNIQASALVTMNGTTDYIEMYARRDTTAEYELQASGILFSAVRVSA